MHDFLEISAPVAGGMGIDGANVLSNRGYVLWRFLVVYVPGTLRWVGGLKYAL